MLEVLEVIAYTFLRSNNYYKHFWSSNVKSDDNLRDMDHQVLIQITKLITEFMLVKIQKYM